MRKLTPAQEEVVYKKAGLFTVRACPGSGKTYSLAARFARLLSSWKYTHQGIAIISFTNVAWEEIATYLEEEYNICIPLRFPHFLGTIDSFVNKYILLPFGHLVMECDKRPILTGPPHDTLEPINNWLWWGNKECNSFECKLNDFTYDTYGNLESTVNKSHFSKCQSNHKYCLRLKNIFNKQGYATQSDANYFSLKLLETHPCIASCLAVRFPVLMVDEAQDTSSVQMKILDNLIEHGLSELMFVGDPDQAIYEWRRADPSLFNHKFVLWRSNSVEFIENWRSSQYICDFASKISSLSETMNAVNPKLIGCQGRPEIWTYSCYKELSQQVQRFLVKCEDNHIKNKAILTRGKAFLNQVIPGKTPKYNFSPWKKDDHYTENICMSKFYFDRGKFKEAYKIIERGVYVCKCGQQFNVDNLKRIILDIGFENWRGELFRLLNCLPRTNCTLLEWVEKANKLINNNTFIVNRKLEIKRNSKKCMYSQLSFEEFFEAPVNLLDDTYYGTIHSIKGRTFDGVFLVLKERDANNRYYSKLIN